MWPLSHALFLSSPMGCSPLSYSVSWSQEGQSVLVWPWTDVLGAGWGQLLAHALSLVAPVLKYKLL